MTSLDLKRPKLNIHIPEDHNWQLRLRMTSTYCGSEHTQTPSVELRAPDDVYQEPEEGSGGEGYYI